MIGNGTRLVLVNFVGEFSQRFDFAVLNIGHFF